MTLGMQKYGRKEGKTTKNKRKQQKKYFGFYQELIFSMGGRGGGRGYRSPGVLFPAFPQSLDHRMVWVKNNPVPTPLPWIGTPSTRPGFFLFHTEVVLGQKVVCSL